MKRSTPASEPIRSGAFMPDGSYNPEGQRGPAHALVSSLRRDRARDSISPSGAAALIRSSATPSAFPYVGQWEKCKQWWECWASTSAEQFVKGAGPPC